MRYQLSATTPTVLVRILCALVFFSLSPSTALAQQQQLPYVDLNVPGAFEKLERSNPEHFQKINTIIRDLDKHTVSEVPRWIQAAFNAKDVVYSYIVLTTSPAQRELSLVLDNTRYRARVTLDHGGAKVFPVKNP